MSLLLYLVYAVRADVPKHDRKFLSRERRILFIIYADVFDIEYVHFQVYLDIN